MINEQDLSKKSASAPVENIFDQILRQSAEVKKLQHKLPNDEPVIQQEVSKSLFEHVAPNSVQAIRAYTVSELAEEAKRLGHHFLYAYCLGAKTKQEVLKKIATSFLFPKYFGKNFDALKDCLTDVVDQAGPQIGFVVVVEAIPIVSRLNEDAREVLIDVFRDVADYWATKQVPYRVFYSFV